MNILCTVAFVVLVLTLTGCGPVRSSSALPAPMSTPAPPIPADWKQFDKYTFIISLPPELKEKKVQGIDTAVWQFEGKEISLSIEIGDLGGDFSFVRDRYESSVQDVTVNRLKAQRLLLDLNKPNLKNWSFNADGSTKVPVEDKHLVTGLYFPDKTAKFWIDRASNVPAETADAILNSIKFK